MTNKAQNNANSLAYYYANRDRLNARHREYIKTYNVENAEHLAKIKHDYYLKHKDKWRELGRKWAREHKDDRKSYYLNVDKARRQAPERRFKIYQIKAKIKDRNFELTFEQFSSILQKPCVYCGVVGKIGVDRADNSLGYTLSNAVPCCWECNRLKGKRDYQTFVALCERIGKHLLTRI